MTTIPTTPSAEKSITADEPSFDYSGLSTEDRRAIRASTEQINSRLSRRKADKVSIGRELIDVKDRLTHGAFGQWLKSEFVWTPRTAQRYMAAAEIADSAKNDNLSHLESAEPSEPELLDFLRATKLVRAAVVRIRNRCEERALPAFTEFLRTLAEQIEGGEQ